MFQEKKVSKKVNLIAIIETKVSIKYIVVKGWQGTVVPVLKKPVD